MEKNEGLAPSASGDSSRPSFLLSFDVEEWFQVENLRPWFPPSQWSRQISRVEYATRRLLDLLDDFDHKVRATFFILGCVAEKHPGLVREIKKRGHEIASHGYHHQLNYHLPHPELFQDLCSSKRLLEDIAGEAVRGYRAPSFSISSGILQTIRAAGYGYDSSYNSFERHGRYGTLDTSSARPCGIALEVAENFFEIPVSNLKWWGQTLPWGGGGYFRVMPMRLFRAGVGKILKQNGAFMMYLHPWEIDPDQPRVKQARGMAAFRHYHHLDKTFVRLKKLISRFGMCRFDTCRGYLAQVAAQQEPVLPAAVGRLVSSGE